jgi:hypothetical protein
MGKNAILDELYSIRKTIWARLQPLLQRPLTREENDLRTSIIREELLPNTNRIRAIENGLCNA